MVFPQCVPALAKDPLIGEAEKVYFGPPIERLLDYCDRLRELVVSLSRPDGKHEGRTRIDILCSLEVDGRRVSILARHMIDEEADRDDI